MSGWLLRGGADEVISRLWPAPNPHLTDPVGWARDRLDVHLWSKQRELVEAVRDHRYVGVQSCHDAGKSFAAALLAAWWIDVHPVGEAFAVSSAPTSPQIEAILWREIGRIHRRGGLPGRITAGNVPGWKIGDELVAYGRRPADYTDAAQAASAFQGIHARYVLVILDEASGIPRWLFDAVDSLATNEHARVLAIGNPDDPASHFATVCAPGSGWDLIRIDGFDTPNFTGETVPDELRELLLSPTWVDERRKRWGEGSPLWQSKVRGLFPDVSDDTLIAPRLIRAAQERDLSGEAISDIGRFGVDVARLGRDQTAVYRNRGGMLRLEATWGQKDTMETAGRLARLLADSGAPAAIDVIGVGAGVYDRLREQGCDVTAFNAAERAYNPARFANRRAEAFWTVRELLENGRVDLDPDDDELASQLGAIRYRLTSSGKVLIESKDQMRARGMPSPDRADAAVVALAQSPRFDLSYLGELTPARDPFTDAFDTTDLAALALSDRWPGDPRSWDRNLLTEPM